MFPCLEKIILTNNTSSHNTDIHRITALHRQRHEMLQFFEAAVDRCRGSKLDQVKRVLPNCSMSAHLSTQVLQHFHTSSRSGETLWTCGQI
ncbi:hypothetical protein V1478_004964 [Vespula squamosa]|uniref:Uncharacterized protein n=1 Tax=Vespula squamosa TaxID=30214 RepID=A0ABD2BFA5_VESSQ